MLERIILTDDGSSLARAAVPRAAALASGCGSDVLVVRVSHAAGLDPDELDEAGWDAFFAPEAVARAADEPVEAEPHLSEVVSDLQVRGVARAASAVLFSGDVGKALVEAADELDVDLVVMSSRGESGLRRYVLGSVAEQLTREARETAILLCPPPADAETATTDVGATEAGIDRIMLTLDGSDLSEIALPYAEDLARALGAELVLLRVTDAEEDLIAASMPVGAPPAASLSVEDAQAIAREQQAVALDELEAVAASLRERGVERVTVEVTAGSPAETIIGVADSLGVDVIAMASHGRGGLGRLVLGSVADSVTRNSERAAVLLVRPPTD